MHGQGCSSLDSDELVKVRHAVITPYISYVNSTMTEGYGNNDSIRNEKMDHQLQLGQARLKGKRASKLGHRRETYRAEPRGLRHKITLQPGNYPGMCAKRPSVRDFIILSRKVPVKPVDGDWGSYDENVEDQP
jgi:hypothetical protein